MDFRFFSFWVSDMRLSHPRLEADWVVFIWGFFWVFFWGYLGIVLVYILFIVWTRELRAI